MELPFENKNENKKFESLYTNVNKDLDEMILSNNTNIMKYLEMVVSALLLEVNKFFPEPNYSFYITYRIKSPKSNIGKLSDYTKRLTQNKSTISIKDFTDIIGLRIIIEKIPHCITINKNIPNYDILKNLYNERKKNISISEENHLFEEKIDNNECTYIDYYTKSKMLLENMIKIFESETIYSPDYAFKLKQHYKTLISECNKKVDILTALGDFDSKINFESIEKDTNPSKINFKALLKDFDSRIDSKLGLALYSSALSEIITKSPLLYELGVSLSSDTSRTKNKREESGYISDFSGLDFIGIPIKTELQIMYSNEHQESIAGYSAHSNMPGKEASFMEIPTQYVKRNLDLLKNIGNSTFINNFELSLLNEIIKIKTLNKNYIELYKELTSESNIVLDNNSPIGLKINNKYLQDLKNISTLDDDEFNLLKENLYNKGCKIFNFWAKNISALHATAKLDKDSAAKNRVKIHYDDAYECLAHTIREQVENHNPKSIDAEYFLERIYKNQLDWLENTNLMSTESSIIDFEIDEYAKNSLPDLLEKINNEVEK